MRNLEQNLSTKPKMKPCPFCGSNDIMFYRDYEIYWEGLSKIHCNNCKMTVTGEWDLENDAIEEWNKRANPSLE